MLRRLALYVVFFGILFLLYSYLETRWIKVKTIVLVSADIPKSFVGKKVVFITDIHHGPFLSVGRVKKLVKQINELNPDLILMGGDYVHREAKYIKPLFDEFKELESTYGVYAVLGNHDHWESAELTRDMMNRNNIYICDNKSYWLRVGNDSIKIGGVGDLWEDSQVLENTTHDVEESNFCVLISHSPDYLENMPKGLVDFTLSGHTHGGQITFFGLWAPVLPSKYGQKYRYGLKRNGNMQSYISSGIGTISPPLRFFCRPEIVLFELQDK